MEIKSKIAVVAILCFDSKVLLLKRCNPPLNWGAPAGRVHVGEKVVDGLLREVKEETGLDCKIIMPVSVWEGVHNGENLLSITFVCEAFSDKVILSDEHEEYTWVNFEQLSTWNKETDMEISHWSILIEVANQYKTFAENHKGK